MAEKKSQGEKGEGKAQAEAKAQGESKARGEKARGEAKAQGEAAAQGENGRGKAQGPPGGPHLRGRVAAPMHPALAAASVSVGFDSRLALFDILASSAHAGLLCDSGVISRAEHDEIISGLGRIREMVLEGSFAFSPEAEDVHMNIERALIGLIGPAGAKLPTGRSRNEQIVADERLYTACECLKISLQLWSLREAALRQAQKAGGALMPGYTHLQRAQPVPLAHHLLAWHEMFERAFGRFLAMAPGLLTIPYGSGALSGTSFRLTPGPLARGAGLGLESKNSMDAVSSRHFLLDYLYEAAKLAADLSRVGEEIILWTSPEWGFARLPDSLTTARGLDPQGRAPAAAELLRGCGASVAGDLVSLLTLVKGLPLTYSRDLQEDKPPLFAAADAMSLALRTAAAAVGGLEFSFSAMEDAAGDPAMSATDLADSLVAKGVPFREAHGQVGRLAAWAAANGLPLNKVGAKALLEHCPQADPEFLGKMSARGQVERRNTAPGAAGLEMVSAALGAALTRLAEDKLALAEAVSRVPGGVFGPFLAADAALFKKGGAPRSVRAAFLLDEMRAELAPLLERLRTGEEAVQPERRPPVSRPEDDRELFPFSAPQTPEEMGFDTPPPPGWRGAHTSLGGRWPDILRERRRGSVAQLLWQGWKDDFDSFYTAAGAMEKRLRAALAAAEDDAEYQDFPLRPKAAARLRSVLKGLVESAGELRLGMKRIVMMEFGKGTVSILYDEETGEECLREGEADFVSDLDRGLLAGYPQAGLWDMGSSADEPDDS